MPSETVINTIGYCGGVFLGICAIPQLVVMWKNRSAHDVSGLWIICYIIGLSLTLVYMVMLSAWAGVISISVQVTLGVVLLVSKVLMDSGIVRPIALDGKKRDMEDL
ncbi:hypothetical protein BASA60_006326 [Batrachochytrium salamandrivorans]|nr:hypothetical protein BASA62_009638 [Batrachochytrium salamandrivorans]KAH6572914.1 hypothetical protein BASA60_006326 [Batrachochytrium salamandrivorans]KAH9267850.1 hypothetical protein BASA83_009673 [Batrachochytrium salamandrivorans]